MLHREWTWVMLSCGLPGWKQRVWCCDVVCQVGSKVLATWPRKWSAAIFQWILETTPLSWCVVLQPCYSLHVTRALTSWVILLISDLLTNLLYLFQLNKCYMLLVLMILLAGLVLLFSAGEVVRSVLAFFIDWLSVQCSAIRQVYIFTDSISTIPRWTSFVLCSWYCLLLSSVANPKALFLVSRKLSSALFVLLTLFSVMSPVLGCDLAIFSVDF